MNWGIKLMAVCVGFCFLLSLAIYILVKEIKVDLVSRQYREEEKNYQQVIEAKQKATQISAFRMYKADPFILLQVPKEQLKVKIKGKVFFYCVYDEQLDKTIQLEPDDFGQQIIPQSWIKGKRYTIKLNWNDGRDEFYAEQELNMNH